MAENDRPADDISPKVTAAALAAAVTTIAVWVIEYTTGIDIPSLVEGAVTTVLVFAGGYLVRDNR
jgi:hypothetical protein